jgi:antitoxin (DNA-binding transcriptional repressor) of toxin-antitoxin stability system
MTEIFNVHEAKTNLSELLKKVEAGEDIIIARSGKPVATLSRYTQPARLPRQPGSLKGKIWLADNWDSDETNAEIARMFFESEIFPPEPKK